MSYFVDKPEKMKKNWQNETVYKNNLNMEVHIKSNIIEKMCAKFEGDR